MYGFGEQETEFTNYVATAENGNFGSSPADITANVTTKRGGSVMERQSPVKRTSRLSSPKKRPYSTPTELSLHRLSPSHGHDREQGASPHQKQVQVESDSDANWDCPDTPTPMTNSQKRSAYLPLGNPTPCPNSKRSSKPKSRSNPPILTSTISNPTPKLEFFESFDNQSPYHSRYFDIVHPQTYSREEETLREFYAHAERKKMREAMETRARPMERRPLMSQPGYVSSTNDGAAMQRPEREHGIHPRMHLAPRQHALDAPLRDNVIGPASNMQRQVSISEDSHLSGGTASSKQSVFSTPGRDEMERKKALVEDDEGPFAKAMSMADLDERRRVVSEQRAGDDRRAAILEAESSQKKRKDRACGLGVGCNVM
ncbi:unnamed protein product [Alternaria alternata]